MNKTPFVLQRRQILWRASSRPNSITCPAQAAHLWFRLIHPLTEYAELGSGYSMKQVWKLQPKYTRALSTTTRSPPDVRWIALYCDGLSLREVS
jgi:hypothetical protein